MALHESRGRKASKRDERPTTNARKRRRSSPSDEECIDQDDYSDSHSSEHRLRSRTRSSSPDQSASNLPTSSYRTSLSAPPRKRKSYGKPTASSEYIKISSVHARQIRPHEDYDYPNQGSPPPNASAEDVDAAICKAIQIRLMEDPEWAEFTKSKAVPPPHKISEVLKQYRFVQRKMYEWEGRNAPFRSSHHAVEKVTYMLSSSDDYRMAESNSTQYQSHVLNALYVDAKWGSDCSETLDLLELYGPNGKRYNDRRIIDMIQNESGPAKGRPVKRLLRLLRQIDKDWISEVRE